MTIKSLLLILAEFLGLSGAPELKFLSQLVTQLTRWCEIQYLTALVTVSFPQFHVH